MTRPRSFFRRGPSHAVALAPCTWTPPLRVLALIGLFVLLQIPFLFSRPDLTHLGRQVDTAMVARNFVEEDPNILLPRIDRRGALTGITGMEFPLYNYLVSLVYRVIGVRDAAGKWLALAFAAAAAVVFFRLAERLLGAPAARYATVALLTSELLFKHATMFLPETLALWLHLASVWFFVRYLDEPRRDALLAAAGACFAVATLVRPYHGAGGVFMALLAFERYGWGLLRAPRWYVFGLASLAPMALWYKLYVPRLIADYGIQAFYMGQSIGETWSELVSGAVPLPRLPLLLFDSYLNWFYLGVIAAYIIFRGRGGVGPPTQAGIVRLALWTAGLTFVLLVATTGEHFTGHAYYMMPLAPYLCLALGAWMECLAPVSRVRVALWTALPFVVVLAQASTNYAKTLKGNPLHQLETFVDAHVPAAARVITNGDGRPTLYFAHRKGWGVPPRDLLDPAKIAALRDQGASHLVLVELEPHVRERLARAYDARCVRTDVERGWTVIALELSSMVCGPHAPDDDRR